MMDESSPDITAELLDKYDRPGPRYTSYPTVPQWRTDFTEDDYRAALDRGRSRGERALAMYVHIPFCTERCHYCGCNVVISKKPGVVPAFLEHVDAELALVADALGAGQELVQLHWGGGTPTYLSVADIERLHGFIANRFQFAAGAEIAIEADPRVTTQEQIQALRSLGFNRISMGVQDLDPVVQQAIGRNQTRAQTQQMYERCRQIGFAGINFDLIYGLPGQTAAGWEKTVRDVIAMGPDRLAVYSYAHLPESLKHQARMDAATIPAPEDKLRLAAIARDRFAEAGYLSIGMDHYARPDDELSRALRDRRLHRNFMGYTTIADSEAIGIGPSAISYIGDAFAQNEKRLFKYYRRLDENRFATAAGLHLSDDDLVRRWVIEQLMCNLRLSFHELTERFGIVFDDYFEAEIAALEPLQRDTLLERTEHGIEISPVGQVFVRNIAMIFDAYLGKQKSGVRYSRTV